MPWEETNAAITYTVAGGDVLAVIVPEKMSGEKCRAYDTHAPGKPIGAYGTVAEAKAAVERHFAATVSASA